MAQQTAVEWFFMTMNIRGLLPNKEIAECYEQAKQMEKGCIEELESRINELENVILELGEQQ